MKTSIRTKFLVGSVLLVLLTATGISTAYYILIKEDQQRDSQDRVRIAFEIIWDDIANRLSTSATRFDDFLQGDANLRMAVHSYNKNTSWIGEKNYINRYLKKGADDLKRFGTAISANRLLLYARDTRLLAVYQREGDQEVLGGYVASLAGNDTFIPLDDSPESREILFGDTDDLPEAPLPSGISAWYDGDIPDVLSSELFRKNQRLGIIITSPIYRNEETIGILVGEIWFSQDIVERYASLSKTAVNLFAGDQLSIGTLGAQEELDPEAMRQIEPCEDILTQDAAISIFSVKFEEREYYQGQCTLSSAQAVIGAITVSLSQEFEQQENKKILTAILTISAIIIVLAFGLSVLISRKTIRSIHNIVSVIARAAEGDLTKTTTVMTRDEIGMLADKLNQMIAQLRNVSGQVKETSSSVNATADVVLRQMESLIRNMEQQSASVDETTNSTQEIDQFIDVVANNTSNLLAASSQILASTQETQASIAEVTTSTDFLTKNLHLISSSVDQVNQSVRQIAENTEHLEEVAQHTETEVHHIDQSLKDLSSNADRAQQLATETMEAATRGQSSVEAAIHGMSGLKEVVANTDHIIREVNTWGERVSSILGIVDDITEQTSLLALNASIISAQAGERGRGFAVVANEIKELATRTKTSTQEIGTLIHELRMKTEEGVNNTAEGLKRADQGMQLANAVKDALNSILESATRSSNRAADTAQVTQQTAASSQTISTRMNEVTVMVSTIKTAIQEERKDIEQVIGAVDNLSGMSEQVNRATLEQKRATEEIVRSMGTVTGQFDGISEQTEILQQHSDHIVAAMRAIESTTGQILRNATEISDDTVKALLQQADELQKSVTIFKVSDYE